MTAVSQDELLRLIAEAIGLTDELVKQYPAQGRWDDVLAVWSYSKGFLAGVYHARSDSSLMALLREKDEMIVNKCRERCPMFKDTIQCSGVLSNTANIETLRGMLNGVDLNTHTEQFVCDTCGARISRSWHWEEWVC